MSDLTRRDEGLPEEREGVRHNWGEERPVVVLDRPPARRSWLDTLMRVLAGLVMLAVLALLAAMLALLLGLVGGMGGLGSGLGGAAGNAGALAQQLREGVSDRFDPAHPPRGEPTQDAEFDELRRLPVSSVVGRSGGYQFTLARLEKRDGAASPTEAQFAVIHRRLETPRETRVGPLVVRQDWDEADYYLYKGESFRLGRGYYKVNWVSIDGQEAAIARYRRIDDLPVTLKFQAD